MRSTPPEPGAPDGGTLPLADITVVALEQAVAVPFATRQLGDLGARIIKVERPRTGDFARDYDHAVHGSSSYFVWLNRGKESIELDIKEAADRRVLDTMVERADVVIQNLAPGAVESLGLDAVSLRADRPDLIHCSVSGYGTPGPFAAKKAYDLLIQCETGLVSVTGTADEVVKVGVSVADIATGMYAFSGILTALYERSRTGEGATIDVAMLDALGEWMTQPMYYAAEGQHPPRRTGARHPSIAPYGPYEAGDGATVFIGVQNDPELATDPRFAANTERVAHDAEITTLVESALARLTADEVVARLDTVGVACARLRTPVEFAAHPQLSARDRWRTVQTPSGPTRALLPPVSFAGREAVMADVPALGQHNRQLRQEFSSTAPEPTP
jgi:crotonobetainyl-CoA:carnitine CoA-transferase CaiB-like acyl-CoA transferase